MKNQYQPCRDENENCCFKNKQLRKKNIEEKKKAQKANMTEKKPVMRFCTHDI